MARLEAVRLRGAVRAGLPLPARQDVVREVLRLRPGLRAALPRLQLQGPPAVLHQDLPLRRGMCGPLLSSQPCADDPRGAGLTLKLSEPCSDVAAHLTPAILFRACSGRQQGTSTGATPLIAVGPPGLNVFPHVLQLGSATRTCARYARTRVMARLTAPGWSATT